MEEWDIMATPLFVSFGSEVWKEEHSTGSITRKGSIQETYWCMQDFRFRFCGEIIRVFIFTFGRFNDKSRWVLEGEGMILASCSFLIRSPSFQKQNIWTTAAASAVFQIEDSCFYLLCSFGNLYLILIFYKANMVVVAYIVGKKISIAE